MEVKNVAVRRAVVAVALIVAVVGCGSDSGNDVPGTSPTGATSAPTVAAGTGVLVDGMPLEVYNCVMDKWNAIVDEWNTLTAARDAAGESNVIVDGVEYATFDDWATAKGHPTSYDDLKADPQVIADCGG